MRRRSLTQRAAIPFRISGRPSPRPPTPVLRSGSIHLSRSAARRTAEICWSRPHGVVVPLLIDVRQLHLLREVAAVSEIAEPHWADGSSSAGHDLAHS